MNTEYESIRSLVGHEVGQLIALAAGHHMSNELVVMSLGSSQSASIVELRWVQAALDDASLQLDECPRPVVSSLVARNLGKAPVYLPGSLLLRGGHQNRVIERPCVVPAGEALPIEVRCVEAGRWGDAQGGFCATSATPYDTSHDLSTDRLSSRDGTSNQRRTWRSVDRFLNRHHRRSSTRDLLAGLCKAQGGREAGSTSTTQLAEAIRPDASVAVDYQGAAILHRGQLTHLTWTSMKHLAQPIVDQAVESCHHNWFDDWGPGPTPALPLAQVTEALAGAELQLRSHGDAITARIRHPASGLIGDICSFKGQLVHASLWFARRALGDGARYQRW